MLYISADLDNQKIRYLLLEGANVTNDSFFFKVTDKGKVIACLAPLTIKSIKDLNFETQTA